jgi:hypothetical protein
LKSIIKSCKEVDKYKNFDNNMALDHIEELLKNQNNKCYYCNLNLDIIRGENNLSQISLDRLDNSKGHIIGNCVLSCLFCNHCKNDSDENDFKYFIEAITKNKITKKMESVFKNYENNEKIIDYIMSSSYHYDKKKDKNAIIIKGNEIKKILQNQNGCCAITGLPFYNKKKYKFPFKMSLDRIDGSKLHTYDNCQLILLGIQYGKHDKTNEEVKKYIEEIRKCN